MNKQLLFLSVQFQSVTHKSYTYNNSLNKRDKKKILWSVVGKTQTNWMIKNNKTLWLSKTKLTYNQLRDQLHKPIQRPHSQIGPEENFEELWRRRKKIGKICKCLLCSNQQWFTPMSKNSLVITASEVKICKGNWMVWREISREGILFIMAKLFPEFTWEKSASIHAKINGGRERDK